MFDAYEAIDDLITDININHYNEVCNELVYRVESGEITSEEAHIIADHAADVFIEKKKDKEEDDEEEKEAKKKKRNKVIRRAVVGTAAAAGAAYAGTKLVKGYKSGKRQYDLENKIPGLERIAKKGEEWSDVNKKHYAKVVKRHAPAIEKSKRLIDSIDSGYITSKEYNELVNMGHRPRIVTDKNFGGKRYLILSNKDEVRKFLTDDINTRTDILQHSRRHKTNAESKYISDRRKLIGTRNAYKKEIDTSKKSGKIFNLGVKAAKYISRKKDK